MREIGDRRAGLDRGAQQPVAILRGGSPISRPASAAAIGGHGRDLADIVQRSAGLAVDQLERHARQEDPVEKALEDRRIAEVPDRMNDSTSASAASSRST